MGIKIWKVKVLEIYNTSILQKKHFLIFFIKMSNEQNVLFSFPVQAITSKEKRMKQIRKRPDACFNITDKHKGLDNTVM